MKTGPEAHRVVGTTQLLDRICATHASRRSVRRLFSAKRTYFTQVPRRQLSGRVRNRIPRDHISTGLLFFL